MRPLFGCAAAMLAVAGATGASAQTTIIERDGPVIIERERPSVVTRERVELSPAQRTTVYHSVTRERAAGPSGVEVRLGARVPRSVELYDMPTTVVEKSRPSTDPWW